MNKKYLISLFCSLLVIGTICGLSTLIKSNEPIINNNSLFPDNYEYYSTYNSLNKGNYLDNLKTNTLSNGVLVASINKDNFKDNLRNDFFIFLSTQNSFKDYYKNYEIDIDFKFIDIATVNINIS
jgi:hypothetical protein